MTGTNWKSRTLGGSVVQVDRVEYYINQIDQILGILMEPLRPSVALTAG